MRRSVLFSPNIMFSVRMRKKWGRFGTYVKLTVVGWFLEIGINDSLIPALNIATKLSTSFIFPKTILFYLVHAYMIKKIYIQYWPKCKFLFEALHALSPSVVDNKLNFEPFVDAVFKNAHQRINFYQKLRSFNVDTTFLKMFYSCFIEYVLTFCSAGTGHFLWNRKNSCRRSWKCAWRLLVLKWATLMTCRPISTDVVVGT